MTGEAEKVGVTLPGALHHDHGPGHTSVMVQGACSALGVSCADAGCALSELWRRSLLRLRRGVGEGRKC